MTDPDHPENFRIVAEHDPYGEHGFVIIDGLGYAIGHLVYRSWNDAQEAIYKMAQDYELSRKQEERD